MLRKIVRFDLVLQNTRNENERHEKKTVIADQR